MTTSEIIEVIKACREFGVNKIEHGDLKLDLMPINAQPDPVLEKKNLQQHEFRIKEEVLENLRLTDPLAYETLVQFDQSHGA